MTAPGLPDRWGQRVSVRSIPTNPWNSDVSTAATIIELRRLAHRYASDPSVQAAIAHALHALPPAASDRDVASAIFYWIRANIRFIEDEQLLYEDLGVRPDRLDKELLIVPPLLLAMPTPMGDCDDFSLLTASMLLGVGIRPYFVTVAADATDQRKFSHIYVCVQLADEGTHLCLDPGNRYPMVPAGWEADKVWRKAIWLV